jgi:hypothetical protein
VGSLVTAAFMSSSPVVLAYVLTGGSLTGAAIGIYELSTLQNRPRIPESLILKKTLLEKGTGRLSYLSTDDPNLLIDWKLYQSGTWVRNKGNQFLYIEKVVEFLPAQSIEKSQK